MIAKYTLRWLLRPATQSLPRLTLQPYASPRHPFSALSRYPFSTHSDPLRSALQKITVEIEGKASGLLESNIVVGQHLDPSTKKVSIALNLTKDYRRIKSVIKSELQAAGFSDVEITLAPKTKEEKFSRKGNLLGVKKIIAVSSCKGGVGKSTIAVNIAATLKTQGFAVGIFDSDIYGPSLPTLINRQGESLTPYESNDKEITPVEYEGIKCMSFGFVGQKSAVMRGPMVSSIVSQLLYQTHWGELDYLVVDMPPGTGDIQLSLCQELKFDGAVIVTTPQRLSFIDVIKGIEMFQDLRVRILGIVENMAYYQCGKCGHEDLIFGRGYTAMIMQQFGIENTIRIPLMAEISKYCDNGTPIALVLPGQHALVQLYGQLCGNIAKELEKEVQRVFVFYNTAQRKVVVQERGKKKMISPYALRLACKCAGCIDQLSGAMLLRREEIDPEVFPSKIEEKGNYAVAVVWSDGHRSSIYPYKRLVSDQIPAA